MIRLTLRALAVQLYNDALDAAAPLVRDAAEVVHDATWGAMLWASKRSERPSPDTMGINAEALAAALDVRMGGEPVSDEPPAHDFGDLHEPAPRTCCYCGKHAPGRKYFRFEDQALCQACFDTVDSVYIDTKLARDAAKGAHDPCDAGDCATCEERERMAAAPPAWERAREPRPCRCELMDPDERPCSSCVEEGSEAWAKAAADDAAKGPR